MDLATNYGSLVRAHFPNARIAADGFHVIRIMNHQKRSQRYYRLGCQNKKFEEGT